MVSNFVFEIEGKEGCEVTHNCLLFEEYKKKSTVLLVKNPPLPNISPPHVKAQKSIYKTVNFRHLQKYPSTVDFFKCVINTTPLLRLNNFQRRGGILTRIERY